MRNSIGVAHHANGMCKVFRKNLALEQSQLALKATAFKACNFVQYALL